MSKKTNPAKRAQQLRRLSPVKADQPVAKAPRPLLKTRANSVTAACSSCRKQKSKVNDSILTFLKFQRGEIETTSSALVKDRPARVVFGNAFNASIQLNQERPSHKPSIESIRVS